MTAAKVVAMFGISGVGKGWLARQLCARRPEILHLEASALMRDALSMSSEALRTETAGAVNNNQQILVSAFVAARAAEPGRLVLFDGHSVIDNDAGLVEIPLGVIAELGPEHIVFVSDQPSVIAERRRRDSRKRPIRTLAELESHQATARAVARAYSSSLGVPFDEVQSGDWKVLNRAFHGRASAPGPI